MEHLEHIFTVSIALRTYKHTHKHTYSEKTEEDLTFFYGSDGRVLPNHVRGTGIKTQLSLFFFVVVDVGAIFSIFRK